ncbi:hypothetical protein [Orgyia leucostigma nucleopolyhedrovirus]|uniref:Uncharacterized protein n=1 Tax=Orgyia leucostigma nucleopolyhedrovirus TaxID=490711 RepID=B0FDS5_9ABAC|nr:hypothetical protein [Orgyia leucostigma nucleopolyhedrovirus]ABY65783.1 hypothetical protein [Orgyia leucostigma nucleopolyhedrovirus]
MLTLRVADEMTVTIIECRLYKIHLVCVDDAPEYRAVLIVRDRKIYYKNQKIKAKVIRLHGLDVDLIPIAVFV